MPPSHQLTVVPPATAAGNVLLVVVTRGGTATASFTFVDPPTATAFSPLTGLPAGGTLVSITGNNLSTATGVTDGHPAAFAILSDTRIAAKAPAHGLGAATIVVTTTGGSDAAPAPSSTCSDCSPPTLSVTDGVGLYARVPSHGQKSDLERQVGGQG